MSSFSVKLRLIVILTSQHNVPRALGGGWQYKQHLLLQLDLRSPQCLHLELQNIRQRVQAGQMRCRGAKQAPTLRRAPSAGGSGAPPRLRRAMPRPGLHKSTRPQELWKQPHLLSLHISPPRNMSRLYHRAPKLAMACCGCPCAHRPLIHPPCLVVGIPKLSTRPRNTTSRCMCASARAKAPHAARAQHAAAPRPGRRAASKQQAVAPRAARKPQGAPLFAWHHGLHALTAHSWSQTTARPPLKHTKGGEGRGQGGPPGLPTPHQTPPATAGSLDQLNQRTRARAAACRLIPRVRPRPSCRRRRRRPRAAGPHPGPAATSATAQTSHQVPEVPANPLALCI